MPFTALPFQIFTCSHVCRFQKKGLFLQEQSKDIFIKMRPKNDGGLNFKFWVFNDPFNQITPSAMLYLLLNWFLCYFKLNRDYVLKPKRYYCILKPQKSHFSQSKCPHQLWGTTEHYIIWNKRKQCPASYLEFTNARISPTMLYRIRWVP